MKIVFDPDKRGKTLSERGIDFTRADEIFAGHHFTLEDTRQDYKETRFITVGKIDSRMVIMVWTLRNDEIRVISMRKANEREKEKYEKRLD
jgi:uncharacterized protein